MPTMLRPEAAGEVSVLPGMIETIVGIIAASVVSHPFAIGVNVRGIGMTRLIAEMSPVLRGGVLFGCALFLGMLALGMLFGTAIRDMHSGIALRRALMLVMLRHYRHRQKNRNRKKSENGVHQFKPSTIQVSEVF